jgi:checkpoint serine/threonine-protein kinase
VFRDPEQDIDAAETPAASKLQPKTSVFGARSGSFAVHCDEDEEPPAPKSSGVFSKPGAEGNMQRPPAFKPVSTASSSKPESTAGSAPVFMKSGLGNGSRFGGVSATGNAPQRGVFTPSSSQSSLVFTAQTPQPVKDSAEEVVDVEESDSFEDEDDDAQAQNINGEEEYAEDVYDDDEYGYGGDSYRMGGGRCGAYDVMTPIAERTCEFTMTTRAFETPSDRDSKSRQSGADAVEVAARLAKELKDAETPNVFSLLPKLNGSNIDDEFSDPEQEVDDIVERTGTLSLADAIVAASSFRPPNPCIPSDPQIIATLLSLFPQEPEFHDHRVETSQLLDGIQKFTNRSSRRGSSKSNSSRSSDEGAHEVELKGRIFEVKEKLGEGGFGAVFLAKDASNDEDEDDEDEYANHYALKVVRPRNIWEYHILRSIHSTLPASVRRSIIQPQALYAFKDESFLVLELCRQGTLLDVVNRAAQAGVMQQGACLDELLVMFFSIELLRFVDAMHSAGFIHGDLKIDNCLLRLEEVPGVASAWSGLYQPSGEGGWCYKGIKMIDFGRTINTRLFPAGQQFTADWKTDARDCMEMNQNKPWTYQTDYFGLAGIIHCMLYGKYFESSTLAQGPNGQYKLATPFKRYWQVDIWTRLFDMLLNPTSVRADGSLPVCQELRELRVEMEEWLQNNCNRSSISLKSLLKKVELSILEL